MRILAIDPAIRNTGYAVVEGDHRRACALDYGTLSIPRSVSQSGCLLAIKQHLGNLIDKWEPDEMAVERIIYVHGARPAGTPVNAGIRCRGRPGDLPHAPLLRGPLEGPHDGEEIHLTVMRV